MENYEKTISEMNQETLKNTLINLENDRFNLDMCDRWDRSDFEYATELHEKIKIVRKYMVD